MLDAAVCGHIFASPNSLQIGAGLSHIASPKGTLIIVKNYTGDRLNFTLASEKARFSSGLPVRMVSVADDVSIGRRKSQAVGRRGLAGVVLAHKIAGAASAAGADLDSIADLVAWAGSNTGTIGVGLSPCDVPGKAAEDSRSLAADEIEIGIGIHNEAGTRRVRPQPGLEDLVGELLALVLDNDDPERNYLAANPTQVESDTVLLVNNLGGLSVLEMSAITGTVVSALETRYGIRPARTYAGTFLTALNGQGFSITILSLPKSDARSRDVLSYLDAPTDAPGWLPSISSETWAQRATERVVAKEKEGPKAAEETWSIPCKSYVFVSNPATSVTLTCMVFSFRR